MHLAPGVRTRNIRSPGAPNLATTGSFEALALRVQSRSPVNIVETTAVSTAERLEYVEAPDGLIVDVAPFGKRSQGRPPRRDSRD